RGAKGSKTYTYFILVNRSGNIHFNPIKIAYFNPESETYETIECKISSLNVKSNGQDLPEILKEEEQEVKAPTMQPYLTHFTQGGTSSIDIFKGWNGTLLLCSPIMLGFV